MGVLPFRFGTANNSSTGLPKASEKGSLMLINYQIRLEVLFPDSLSGF